MNNHKLLIAIATYKEAENIIELIKKIRHYTEDIDILIVNDKSDDNTKELLEEFDKNIILIERPKKLGLGTAHVLCMLYAIKHRYDFILTMDADFSHDPVHIPSILKLTEKNSFVIGSRFCKDGKSDYKGFKKIISYIANNLTRNILSIRLKEITTYFRLYDVKTLMRLPFNELNAQGYSLGVKIVWLLNIFNVKMLEVPIHMRDRNKGKSKIPKFQIFVSAFDLVLIKIKDIFLKKKIISVTNKTYDLQSVCNSCNQSYSILLNKDTHRCLICLNNQSIVNE